MTSDHKRPSTLAGIKRRAKSIKRERGISHTLALDAASLEAGYQNIRHAQRVLAQVSPPASLANEPATAQPAAPPRPEPMAENRPRPEVATPPTPTVADLVQRRPFTSSAQSQNARERLRSNENTLRAILDGRITGMGYETGPTNARAAYEQDQARRDGYAIGVNYSLSFNSAESLAREISRLEQLIEQDRALLRMAEA